MPNLRRRLVLVCLLLCFSFSLSALAGCGRTSLETPHAFARDASTDAAWNDDAAQVTTIPLSRAQMELVLVIDRSGSMELPIDETSDTTRWEALTASLERALGALEPDVAVGAKLYPDATAGVFEPAQLCATSPGLTVAPSFEGRTRVIQRMRSGPRPRGGTPTADAIAVASSALEGTTTRRAIVLVTDGAPNCNPDTGVPPQLCTCSTEPGECLGEDGAFLCLDDTRTLGAIDQAVAAGTPVVVVGIDDPARPDLMDVLDRMAVAGGRPRPVGSGRRFHSARSARELEEALRGIGDALSPCTFVPNGGGVLDGAVSIELESRVVPESATNGWTRSPLALNAVELHGSYCTAARLGREVIARVTVQGTMELTFEPLRP